MAELLPNDQGQRDAEEIVLAGFPTLMAFQTDAQTRQLMQPAGSSKPRRGRRGSKKHPQRGLGVAQLEKIRLEDNRRASQQAQELAALQQLQASPPFLHPFNSTAAQAPAGIIPQLDRETTHAHSSPPPSSSFLVKKMSAGFHSALHGSVTTATPSQLFPAQNLAMLSFIADSDDASSDKNSTLHQAETSLSLPHKQSNEAHDHVSLDYSLLQQRQNCLPIVDFWTCGPVHQVANRNMALPLCRFETIMELSSFQYPAMSLREEQLVFPQGQAWSISVQQPGTLPSERPSWAIPLVTHSSSSIEQDMHDRRLEEDCELSLRPPGRRGNHESLKEERPHEAEASSGRQTRGPQNFLSLSVGCMWDDIVADASSSTLSLAPAMAKTTTKLSNSNGQIEDTSPLFPWIPMTTNLPFTKLCIYDDSQKIFVSTNDVDIDLTLKL